jgi:hypothetical protein
VVREPNRPYHGLGSSKRIIDQVNAYQGQEKYKYFLQKTVIDVNGDAWSDLPADKHAGDRPQQNRQVCMRPKNEMEEKAQYRKDQGGVHSSLDLFLSASQNPWKTVIDYSGGASGKSKSVSLI